MGSESVGEPGRAERIGGYASGADAYESRGNGEGIVEDAARIVGEDGGACKPT